ncbi:unnamed protein product, partial [Amoebophrya sp. A25]
RSSTTGEKNPTSTALSSSLSSSSSPSCGRPFLPSPSRGFLRSRCGSEDASTTAPATPSASSTYSGISSLPSTPNVSLPFPSCTTTSCRTSSSSKDHLAGEGPRVGVPWVEEEGAQHLRVDEKGAAKYGDGLPLSGRARALRLNRRMFSSTSEQVIGSSQEEEGEGSTSAPRAGPERAEPAFASIFQSR